LLRYFRGDVDINTQGIKFYVELQLIQIVLKF